MCVNWKGECILTQLLGAQKCPPIVISTIPHYLASRAHQVGCLFKTPSPQTISGKLDSVVGHTVPLLLQAMWQGWRNGSGRCGNHRTNVWCMLPENKLRGPKFPNNFPHFVQIIGCFTASV